MAGDQVKALLQLASGLGDLTRARARDVAHGLLELPGGESTGRMTGQAAALADELLATATANRENLLGLVRAEVEAAVGRLGLAPASQDEARRQELEHLRSENASLRAKLELRDAADATAGRTARSPARKRSTTRAAEHPAGSTPERGAPEGSPAKRSTAKRAPAKRAPAKRAPAKRAPAKRSPAGQATTTRATTTRATTAREPTADASKPGSGS